MATIIVLFSLLFSCAWAGAGPATVYTRMFEYKYTQSSSCFPITEYASGNPICIFERFSNVTNDNTGHKCECLDGGRTIRHFRMNYTDMSETTLGVYHPGECVNQTYFSTNLGLWGSWVYVSAIYAADSCGPTIETIVTQRLMPQTGGGPSSSSFSFSFSPSPLNLVTTLLHVFVFLFV